METARPSLRHSCRSELTRQGISLPQDRYSYGRRFTGASIRSFLAWLTPSINSSSTGQASHRIRPLSVFAQCCVLINSCSQLSIFDWQRRPRGTLPTASVPSPEVTAPFCLVPSPEFSQAPEYSLPDHRRRFGGTIVGNPKLRGFSRKRGINCFTTLVVRHHISALVTGFA